MLCKYCGSELKESSKFCMICGNIVETKVPESEDKDTNEKARFTEVNNTVHFKSQNRKKAAWIIIISFVLIVVGIMLYFVIANGSSKERIISNAIKAVEHNDPERIMSMIYEPTKGEYGEDIFESHYSELIENLREEFEHDLGTTNYKISYTYSGDGEWTDVEEYPELIPEEYRDGVLLYEQSVMICAEANGDVSDYEYDFILVEENHKWYIAIFSD